MANVFHQHIFNTVNKKLCVLFSILVGITIIALEVIVGITEQIKHLILIFLLIILVMTLFYMCIRRILLPLVHLQNAALELEHGNLNVRTDLRTNDEFESLGDIFNKTVETLQNLEEQRRQIEKSKTEFLSITSHELRSPMTPMKAHLQILLEEYDGKLNKNQKQSVDVILRNTERLDRIIQDLLEISRIEAARLKFNFIKANLPNYIKRLIIEMDNFLPEKNIKIHSKIKTLPVIEVDPDRVMQVLRNLISNAKKFSPPNTTITLDAKVMKNHIQFSVSDEGIGIKLEDQQRLFEPFYQVEHTLYREYSGTGLGLAICRGIVQSQEGTLWLESTPNGGSTFYFTIPFTPVKESKLIRVMFSEKNIFEKNVLDCFKKNLGPLGEGEFQSLKERQALTQDKLLRYIDVLEKNKIVPENDANLFKEEIVGVFNGAAKNIEFSKRSNYEAVNNN